MDAVTNFVFLWTTFCNLLRIGKLYLVTFLECKPFFVLWERTCLKKSCFPGYFWHSLFPLDIWWFDRKSFFRVRRGLRTSAHPKKTFPVSPPNVLREKFMSKKSWKVAFLQARPFSRPKKSLHPSKVTRTDHSTNPKSPFFGNFHRFLYYLHQTLTQKCRKVIILVKF